MQEERQQRPRDPRAPWGHSPLQVPVLDPYSYLHGVWTPLPKAILLVKAIKKFGALKTAGQSVSLGLVYTLLSVTAAGTREGSLSEVCAVASTFLCTRSSPLPAPRCLTRPFFQEALPDHPSHSLMPAAQFRGCRSLSTH